MKNHASQLLIGTSGWQYDHWRGVFYPDGVPQKRWLEYYAAQFDTVEVNNTFYHLPRESTFDAWRVRAPKNFRYVLKYSRYGTHLKHLADPHGHIDLFMARASRLGECLYGVLVQLPPHWPADPKRLGDFLDAAPATVRWAVEFRDGSWLREDVYRILREHNAALCIHDLVEAHPIEITSGWIYLRFHGSGAKYAGCYSSRQLTDQAEKISRWLADGYDVAAYFNNDAHGYAVQNAISLRAMCTGE